MRRALDAVRKELEEGSPRRAAARDVSDDEDFDDEDALEMLVEELNMGVRFARGGVPRGFRGGF